MPQARNGTVSLHYESTGAGAPVLLVMGLGMNATGWWRTVPVLTAAGLRALTLDNSRRRPQQPFARPYITAVMADDAVAVLDAAAVQRAHIYGISLGGMIAQKIALRHPDRVARLILGATTPGATAAVPANGPTFAFFQRRLQMPAEEAVRTSIPHNCSDQTRAEHGEGISENIRERLRFPIEPRRIPHNSPPHSGTTPMIGSRGSPRPHSWSTASRT